MSPGGFASASGAAPSISAAGVDDADAIARLFARSLPAPWSSALVAATLRSRAGFGLVAREGSDAVVACALITVAADEAQLLQLAVLPERRRGGLGRRLLRAGLGVASGRGASECFLEVRASNRPALALYDSEGFTPAGRRRAYYTDGEDAVVLRCVLAMPGPA